MSRVSSQDKDMSPGQLQSPILAQKPMAEVEDAHCIPFTFLTEKKSVWKEHNLKVHLARQAEWDKPGANGSSIVPWCKMTTLANIWKHKLQWNWFQSRFGMCRNNEYEGIALV